VNITTDHPRQHHAHLQISGFVRPVIAVTPPTIALGSRPLDPGVVGTLRVQVFSSDAIEVTSADSDLKGLAFELEPVQGGRDYKVRVSVTADLPKGDFHGTIRVHTASPKSPVVEVPISGHRD
jgi:hypothetical protein